MAGLPVQNTKQMLPWLSFCCAVLCCAVLCCPVLCCAKSLFCVQVAGLQVVVDQGAIDRAVPLLPGTRMTLPLMLHCPQVCRHPPCLVSCAQGPQQASQPLSAKLNIACNSPMFSSVNQHLTSQQVCTISMHSAPHSGCVRAIKDS